MTTEELESRLRAAELDEASQFEVLREVATLHNQMPGSGNALDAIIRVLDRRNEFSEALWQIIDSLAVSAGLFPYVAPGTLDTAESLRVELSRPIGLDDGIVFHDLQNQVYRMLVDGESVILSAPTSFGKSLVIDGVIASGRYANIVIVVPTIALIDETRRRMQSFRETYRIITHQSQQTGKRNVFVLTQERVLDFKLPPVDFFVIDEFYKLGMEQDPDRASLLNLAFYELRKTAKAFYLLGPSIHAVTESVQANVQARFVATEFKTVLSEVTSVPSANRNIGGLLDLCEVQEEPTLIFSKSPPGAREIAKALAERLGESR